MIDFLDQQSIAHQVITYGNYNIEEYKKVLNTSMAMIFLCEHESQGFACCEAMAVNVPVLAWDQGFWLDPNRFNWGPPLHIFSHNDTTLFTNFLMAATSGEKSAFLPTPPAIKINLPFVSCPRPSMAANVAPTFVPFESLYQNTPSRSQTS